MKRESSTTERKDQTFLEGRQELCDAMGQEGFTPGTQKAYSRA